MKGTRGRRRRFALAFLPLWLACASEPPPLVLPSVRDEAPSEALPIDGLYRAPALATGTDEAPPEAPATPTLLLLDRGRLFVISSDDPEETWGSLRARQVHQLAPLRYRAEWRVVEPEAIRWQRVLLELEEDALVARARDDEADVLARLELVAAADETWFRGQQEAWSILSAREAHGPPEPVTPTFRVAPLPPLPPPPPRIPLPAPPPRRADRFGRYHALVIGSGDYQYLPLVATAETDADAVSRLLRTRYDFDVTDVRNGSRKQWLAALERYRRELDEDDNLLVYYAGHGHRTDEGGRCYWFPVDATEDDQSRWLSNDDVTSLLRELKAKHVMVVADSCFSAGSRREAGFAGTRAEHLERVAGLPARVVLSSGGLEPMQAGGSGGHSVFTGAFLEALRENDTVLDGTSLYAAVVERVTARASQTPEYADLRGAEDARGDFLFVAAE